MAAQSAHYVTSGAKVLGRCLERAKDCDIYVEHNLRIETIQVLWDKHLLPAADKAAKRVKITRSALI